MSSDPPEPLGPAISVVLASIESEANLAAAIAALRVSCVDLTYEIIVVDASRDGSARIASDAVAAGHGDVVLLEREAGTIAPDLWAEGMRSAGGRVIALTTGHCIVGPDWATDLLATIDGGADAAGAGLLPVAGVRRLDLAVYFLRYHAFIGLTSGSRRPVREIPGDNAAYPARPVRDYLSASERGFYEVEYHRELRAAGADIVAVPTATAGFGRSFPVGTITRHRFAHGRQFGSWRVQDGGESVVLIVLKSPAVPVTLFLRAWSHSGSVKGLRRKLLGSLPFFALLSAAWSAGEAAGAVFGSPLHE